MKCEMCGKNNKAKLCATCHEFIGWAYPDEDPYQILIMYNDLKELHYFLREKKRK